MTVTSATSRAGQQAQMLGQLRNNLYDLQTQLGTGKVAQTYGGLGPRRGAAVALQQSLAAIGTFQGNITNLDTRISIMSTSLTQVAGIGQQVKKSATPGVDTTQSLNDDGRTASQNWARGSLYEMFDLLNGTVGDRYLFSGLAGKQRATEDAGVVLTGQGVRAGFEQVVTERRQADLGNATGWLATSTPAAATVRLADDQTHALGFKAPTLTGTTIAGAVVTNTAPGAPASSTASLDLSAATVADGDTVNYALTLPDGSTQTITLTATTDDVPAAGEFAVGATAQATADNFKAVLDSTITTLGAAFTGRLVMSTPNGTSTARIAEDGSHPFGFKAPVLTTDIAGATVANLTGSPASATIDLSAATPKAGNLVKLTLALPDGSSETVSLKATTSATPKDDEFTIGATSQDTTDSLNVQLRKAVGKLGDTALRAASAIAAGDDFFDVDATHMPQRVDGPPFDTATQLIDGTAADTVIWYTGESGTTPSRATMTGRIDTGVTVSFGVRANDAGVVQQIKNVAVFAAVRFDAADPNVKTAYDELGSRVAAELNTTPGTQSIQDIQAELAGVQVTMASTKARHTQRAGQVEDLLATITDADPQAVSMSILTLQTVLQASLQTTSKLFQLSLVNYI